MRILLMILALLIPSSVAVRAETTLPTEVEKIDVKLAEHQAAVTFLGLTTGEATLVQGPNGENILINIGGQGELTELEGWLSLYNVKELSTLILTNNDEKISIEKVGKLWKKYNIKEIVTTPEVSALLTREQSNQIPITVWNEGTKKEILPEMFAYVQFLGNQKNEGMDLMLRFFKHNLFLMTSFSQRAEQELLAKNLVDIHVFKIPYTLTKDSLSDQLIQTLNPQISILFGAEEDQLDQDLLRDLQGIWSEVYFTKKHGTVTIKFTESNYEIITIPLKEAE
ncbi:ATP-dependent DNA helicase [Bacillus sp. AFS076308]|uniref:ATP-dependent DNA helicase n=1 Tax=unclassified Bacillus (in: firmicutes) TaxID=185979 RepID=UPI000BF590DB|nr:MULTISPECIES: ATP-dependent DNA helicase [unclassified Bacillus (in: firmicutes)]PFO02441.1 ATP-dependent DNA helicase [Bacillus sp. AFS076308]PGV55652.1 ATP-dependent DNA helicase [Bacillus sp. AFS037270]